MLRRTLLGLSRNAHAKQALVSLPLTRAVVDRFVPGETSAEAVDVVAELVASGRLVSLDVLGEDTTDERLAERAVSSYLDLLAQLSARGLSGRAEVSVKLSVAVDALSTSAKEKIVAAGGSVAQD